MGFFRWLFLDFFGWVFYCQPCLGRGGGLDVPVAHARVVHVRVVFIGEPFDGGVLAQESGAWTEILPGQARITLVIVLRVRQYLLTQESLHSTVFGKKYIKYLCVETLNYISNCLGVCIPLSRKAQKSGTNRRLFYHMVLRFPYLHTRRLNTWNWRCYIFTTHI